MESGTELEASGESVEALCRWERLAEPFSGMHYVLTTNVHQDAVFPRASGISISDKCELGFAYSSNHNSFFQRDVSAAALLFDLTQSYVGDSSGPPAPKSAKTMRSKLASVAELPKFYRLLFPLAERIGDPVFLENVVSLPISSGVGATKA